VSQGSSTKEPCKVSQFIKFGLDFWQLFDIAVIITFSKHIFSSSKTIHPPHVGTDIDANETTGKKVSPSKSSPQGF